MNALAQSIIFLICGQNHYLICHIESKKNKTILCRHASWVCRCTVRSNPIGYCSSVQILSLVKERSAAARRLSYPNTGFSFLEQDDVNVVVDALQKQLPLEIDHLLLLGGLQGAHQRFEDVGTTVVIKQDPELYTTFTVSVWNKRFKRSLQLRAVN